MSPRKSKDRNTYPAGWNRKRVEQVIHHYEQQIPTEEVAEDEAYRDSLETMYSIPNALVPAVQALVRAFKRAKKHVSATGKRATKRSHAARIARRPSR